MKFSYLMLILVFGILSCQENEKQKINTLEKTVDSLNNEIAKRNQSTDEEKNNTEKPINSAPLQVYAFCIIHYDYWTYGGPTFDGKEPKKTTYKQSSISDISMVDNFEDSKSRFKDNFESTWRNSRPSYEINHTKIQDITIKTYNTYTEASNARRSLITN